MLSSCIPTTCPLIPLPPHPPPLHHQAAAVYCNMLQHPGIDRAQQAILLRKCLECWTLTDVHANTGSCTTGSTTSSSSPSGHPHNSTTTANHTNQRTLTTTAATNTNRVLTIDAHTLDKLALLVEQHGMAWGTMLDIATQAAQGPSLALSLCEQLLRRYAGPGSAGGPSLDAARWALERELLLRYVQLSMAAMREEHAVLTQQLHEARTRGGGEGVVVVYKEGPGGGRGGRRHGRTRRVLGCVTVGVCVLLSNGIHPVARVVGSGLGLLLAAPLSNSPGQSP